MTSFGAFPVDKFAKAPQQIKENMKTIKYNNKTIKLPFSGEKATVPGYAAAVYDVIMGAQVTHRYDLVQKGCDWFSRNFPKQYMVLLD